MKEGTLYAERLKKAYSKLRHSTPAPDIPEPIEPVRCLALGILGTDQGPAQAESWLDRALSVMVDWNEIRVSSPKEVAEAIAQSEPESIQRSRNLIDALQAIFLRENKVSLERLKLLGRREAKTYLETLKGVDEYAVAYVVLWSLGGHAIPVASEVVEGLREAELIHPTATRFEVQAFMERNIAASDAKEFTLLSSQLGKGKRPVSRRAPSAKDRSRETAK